MPRYKFKSSNLPPSLLDALCSDLLDLGNPDDDPESALQEVYGARRDDEFIRDAWPTLLSAWLPTAREARESIVQSLQEARREETLLRGRGAQLAYLRDLRNAKHLREIVWAELVVAGEVEWTSGQTRASREPSTVTRQGTQTRDGRRPRQKRSKVEKSLEATLWEAADALRGNQDPSEYKHVVLGLVFLKYISDQFVECRRAIEAALSNPDSEDYIPNEKRRAQFIEDRDEYATIDWNLKDSVKAAMRSNVRRLLAKYDYPPGREEKAIELVLQQAELFAGSEVRAR